MYCLAKRPGKVSTVSVALRSSVNEKLPDLPVGEPVVELLGRFEKEKKAYVGLEGTYLL